MGRRRERKGDWNGVRETYKKREMERETELESV